jgi:predicted 2-oxoglutarate/Fe(II)-dependent dioxygenase YbiX
MDNVLFSKEDCEYIKSFWDDFNSIDGVVYRTTNGNYRKDTTTVINGATTVQLQTENGRIITIKPKNAKLKFLDLFNKELINFILSRLSKIGIKSILNNQVKITKYIEGDFFAPHRDFRSIDEFGCTYKTLVIQLSDPKDYVGGYLYVKDVPQSKEQGSYSLFLSSDIHEVKLLEEGIRFSLTIFLYESDFSSAKSKLL